MSTEEELKIQNDTLVKLSDKVSEVEFAISRLPNLNQVEDIKSEINKLVQFKSDLDILKGYFSEGGFFKKTGLVVKEFEKIQNAFSDISDTPVLQRLSEIENILGRLEEKINNQESMITNHLEQLSIKISSDLEKNIIKIIEDHKKITHEGVENINKIGIKELFKMFLK